MSLFSQQVLFNNSILSILPTLSIPIAQCRVNVRRLEHKHKNNRVNSEFLLKIFLHLDFFMLLYAKSMELMPKRIETKKQSNTWLSEKALSYT